MLDLPKVLKLTLFRGGIFVVAFVLVEFFGSVLFGPTDKTATRDALNFLLGPSFYLMFLFFIAILTPRAFSIYIFVNKKKLQYLDPVLLYKSWESQ